MRTAILCMLLSAACALVAAAPVAIRRRSIEGSDSEERDREAIQIFFDSLKDLTRAGGYGEQFRIPESSQQSLLVFLDRLNDIALSSIGDKSLSDEARNKKQFLAVLDLIEELVPLSVDDEDDTEVLLGIIDQTRVIVKQQPDDAPPDREAFRPVFEQLLDLARAHGASGQEMQQILSIMDSVLGDSGVETTRVLRGAWSQ